MAAIPTQAKTALKINESVIDKIEEDENEYCETPKWD